MARAPLTALPRPPSWIKGGLLLRGGEGRGGRRGRGRGGEGEARKGKGREVRGGEWEEGGAAPNCTSNDAPGNGSGEEISLPGLLIKVGAYEPHNIHTHVWSLTNHE